MTSPLALTVARMHCVLGARRNSDVVHAYVGPITPAGRSPRNARPVCSARTRPLTILRRSGVVVDTHGRRLCANCSARLMAIARRAEQPPSNIDARAEFWRTAAVTSADLVVALAVATSVADTHAIGHVTNVLFGMVHPSTTRRPATPGVAQGRYDFEVELIARRDQLRTAERTPEEREAAAAKRELDDTRAAQVIEARKKADRMSRAVDRRNAGRYLMPHEKALLDTA